MQLSEQLGLLHVSEGMGQERTITVSKPATTEPEDSAPSNQSATDGVTATAQAEDFVQDTTESSSDEHLASKFVEQPSEESSYVPLVHGE